MVRDRVLKLLLQELMSGEMISHICMMMLLLLLLLQEKVMRVEVEVVFRRS